MKLQITFHVVFTAMCSVRGSDDKLIKLAPGSYLVDRSEEDGLYVFRNETFYFSIRKIEWENGNFQKCRSMSAIETA